METNNQPAMDKVRAALQHNTVMFNTVYQHASNLMNYKERISLYMKSEEEKSKIRKARKNFKSNVDVNREEIVKAFVNHSIPNWNIKFILTQ